MNRIIIHWTAGTYCPNQGEKEHYHYLIDDKGILSKGKYTPEDNINCYDGKYAQHTGGGNTGSIGISMCGMYVPEKTDIHKTKYPLTKIQCEKLFKTVAELCKKYNIKISPNTVMTHYEFGKRNPKTTSAGKIDIIWLPPYPSVTKDQIGDFIRSKVEWYILKL